MADAWQQKPVFDWNIPLTVDGKHYRADFQTMHTGNCATCLLLELYFYATTSKGSFGVRVSDADVIRKLCAALYEAKFKSGQGPSEHFAPGQWDYPVVTWVAMSPVSFNTDGIPCDKSNVPDFFNWLIENEIGMVMASPVHTNARYLTKGPGAHLNQCWYWIPPVNGESKHRAILKGTGGFYGKPDSLPDFEDESGTPELRSFEKVLNRRFAGYKQYAKAGEFWDKKVAELKATRSQPVAWNRKK